MGNHSERAILRDLREKTGLHFTTVAQIDTRDPSLASKVLPVVRSWVSVLGDVNCRNALYHLFHTELAGPYWENLVEWWKTEQDRIGSSCLTQCLTLIVSREQAESIWEVWKSLHPKPMDSYYLVARLAEYDSVSKQVKDEMLRALDSAHLTQLEFSSISKVEDRRIRTWFLNQEESKDLFLRKLARRVAARRKRLPAFLAPDAAGPDRARQELFSAEVDLFAMKEVFDILGKRFELRLPKGLRAGRFLESAPVNSWLRTDLGVREGRLRRLWFRLEDIDVVEIVLTEHVRWNAPIPDLV